MYRRTFLRRAFAAGAAAAVPAVLAGCVGVREQIISEPVPVDPLVDWFGFDREVLARAVSILGAGGGDFGEVYVQHRTGSSLRIEHGELIRGGTDVVRGAGMRIRHGETGGYAATGDLSPDALLAAARRASRGVAESGTPVLLNELRHGNAYEIAEPWSDVVFADKLAIAEYVDAAVRRSDQSVSGVTVNWADEDERVAIATLDGQLMLDRRPLSRLSVQVDVTRDGVTHSGFAALAARAGMAHYAEARLDALVNDVVEQTRLLFDARRPPGGGMPVILAGGTGGVLLHETIGHAFEADLVANGKSPYRDALGTSIAEAEVTIVDDATLPNERGSLNVDDEGVPCRRNVIVENGVLKSFLHDRGTAAATGAEPNGNGRRESYRHEPLPRMTCTFMENGPHERNELIEAMGRGVIAERFTGGHVDLGNGDFEFTVRQGWMVEKGQVLMPIRDFKLVGNGPELLRGISMVANDGAMDPAGWTCGKNGQNVPVSHGMPAVLTGRLGIVPLS